MSSKISDLTEETLTTSDYVPISRAGNNYKVKLTDTFGGYVTAGSDFAIDNLLLRSDGTGKGAQTSGWLILDTGEMAASVDGVGISVETNGASNKAFKAAILGDSSVGVESIIEGASGVAILGETNNVNSVGVKAKQGVATAVSFQMQNSNGFLASFSFSGTANRGIIWGDKSGTVCIQDDAAITGGTINNASIGATTRSSGAFTTLAANGATTLTANTASTTTTTGTLVVTGGVGVSGAINAGGVSKITDVTEASSSTTGCLVLSGGLGLAKQINCSTNIIGQAAVYSPIFSPLSGGILKIWGSTAGAALTRLRFNGDTSSFPAFQISGTTITTGLADGTSGGTLAVSGILKHSSQSLTGAGAADVVTSVTKITSTGAAQAISLADGVDGQIKTIVHDVDGGSFILTPTTKTGFTTFTSTAAGETISLLFVTVRGWVVIGSFGGVIA